MEIGNITAAFHAGITVSNMEQSLRFYRDLLGFELIFQRVAEEDEIKQIVSVAGLQSIRIAMLHVPGSDFRVELLEYQGVERFSASCRPCDPGSGHLCLFVKDLVQLHARLSAEGVCFRSEAPIEILSGERKGTKVIYMIDPDGYIIELMEPANSTTA